MALAPDRSPLRPVVVDRWIRSDSGVVIPRSTSEEHIRENYEARRLALDDADIERIDAIDRRECQVDFEGAP